MTHRSVEPIWMILRTTFLGRPAGRLLSVPMYPVSVTQTPSLYSVILVDGAQRLVFYYPHPVSLDIRWLPFSDKPHTERSGPLYAHRVKTSSSAATTRYANRTRQPFRTELKGWPVSHTNILLCQPPDMSPLSPYPRVHPNMACGSSSPSRRSEEITASFAKVAG